MIDGFIFRKTLQTARMTSGYLRVRDPGFERDREGEGEVLSLTLLSRALFFGCVFLGGEFQVRRKKEGIKDICLTFAF